MRSRQLIAGSLFALLLSFATNEAASGQEVPDVYGAPAAPPPPPGARVTVKLPPDALLLIDGRPTRAVGDTRVFATPPLPPGFPFIYEFSAAVFRGRQWVHAVERIVVWSGEETRVTFHLPPPAESIKMPKVKP